MEKFGMKTEVINKAAAIMELGNNSLMHAEVNDINNWIQNSLCCLLRRTVGKY